MAEDIGVASIKVVVDSSGVTTELNTLTAAAKKAASVLTDSGSGATAAQVKLTESIKKTRDALELQVATFGKNTGEVLAFKAGLLGVATATDADTKAISSLVTQLNSLKAASATAVGSMTTLAANQKTYVVSAAQTAAAVRNVPAQFTDIVTSLQGGQNPLTVLLQQGGQLKDMFGGVGNAARALGTYVLGLVNPFTVAAAAVGVVGYSFYASEQRTKDFQKALIFSGNAVGATVGQLQDIVFWSGASSGSIGIASDALAQLAASGKVSYENLVLVTRAITNMSIVSGRDVKELVAEYLEIGKAPVEALIKLNDQYHFLTLRQLETVQSLVAQGREVEAVNLAQGILANASLRISAQAIEQMGYWANAIRYAKNEWEDFQRAMKVFVPPRFQESAIDAQKRILQDKLDVNKVVAGTFSASEIASERTLLALLEDKEDRANQAVKAQGERARNTQAAAKALVEIEKVREAHFTKTEKLAKAIADHEERYRKIRVADPKSKELSNEAVDRQRIEDAFKEKPKKAPKESTAVFDAAERYIKQLDEQVQRTEKLTTVQKVLIDIANGGFTPAQAAAAIQLALVNDHLKAQTELSEQVVKAMEDWNAEHAKLADATLKEVESLNKSNEELRFQISLIGKTATEQFALEQARRANAIAILEEQLATAQKNSSTEAEIEAIQQLIAAKREEVGLRGQKFTAEKVDPSDYLGGAQSALKKYSDSVADVNAQTQQAVSSAFQGMEDSLVKFVTTGKGGFHDFADSIIAELARMAVKQAIMAPFLSWLGGVMGTSTAPAGAGVITGGTGLTFQPKAMGISHVPFDNYPALLHQGERVMTAKENREGGGGGPMKVTVINNGTGEVSTNQLGPNELEVVISAAVNRVNSNIASGTGSTSAALKSRGVNLSGNLPRRA